MSIVGVEHEQMMPSPSAPRTPLMRMRLPFIAAMDTGLWVKAIAHYDCPVESGRELGARCGVGMLMGSSSAAQYDMNLSAHCTSRAMRFSVVLALHYYKAPIERPLLKY